MTLSRGRQKKPPAEEIVRLFHQLYYRKSSQTWKNTRWMGVPLFKCPLDLWIYQELMVRLKPDLVIETGTYRGGSALYLAGVLDLIGRPGQVLTIDIEPPPKPPRHQRIVYLTGHSTSKPILAKVGRRAKSAHRVMAILDSDHAKDHVLAEMRAYGRWVTPGSYLIVEDSNINGHPVRPRWGPGPAEAIQEFLARRQDFQVDRRCEKFLRTQNPGGYLRKVKK